MNKGILAAAIISAIILVTTATSSLGREAQYIELGKEVVKLVFDYQDLTTVGNHMARLEKLVTPEVFGVTNGEDEKVFVRRNKTYTPTVSHIKEASIRRGKETVVMLVVGFNTQSMLEDRLVILTLNKDNIVIGYEEKIFKSLFDMPSDYLKQPVIYSEESEEH